MAAKKKSINVNEVNDQVITPPNKRFFWQFPIVKLRYWWFALSLIIIIPGIISLFLNGLNFGIDFKGGTLLDMTLTNKVSQQDITSVLESAGLKDSRVQLSTENDVNKVIIRTRALEESERDSLLLALEQKTGAIDRKAMKEDKVGPSIGKELQSKALWSLGIASLLMIIYLTIRFEFLFGVSAIIAILHDVLVTMGIFSLFGWEVDSSFVAAVLTVVGYSINDTVVIFDRVRENQQAMRRGDSYEDMVDKSVWQTMGRSINTVLTVLITLFAIYFLGGPSTKIFALAMLIGVFSGAYSSIFNASQILVELKNWQARRVNKAKLVNKKA